ncbi:ABC transporter ATP-binding protein [Ereboglobus luteus]|uniref:Sugar ABC transporter ATP-binding protein n=1 Tax=Ereboglobus luteus TaxID=1796921 RepID=A0A2U8E020_9BACT|nr:sn-glycerol-3-phosphate ABC transporter ATP-binding protein UgpC [Ereboglobus luteus]AWI08151.1 sugar ABC transporter ATP-binding protein [Ereboglobus luteus]
MAQVSIKKLVKIYPEKGGRGNKVVHGIDLEIRDREFMVLVGPSGCGKSTTLRMIAGLEDISGGEISIDGRVINDVLPKDRDIAMVFQNYALYPHMTVYDNMAFGLKLRKFSRAEIDARVREASAMLGLDPYLERLPKALSGGQRQRVAVGRAIVRRPKVFLFDEPLSNLDAKMRVSTRTEISRLHERLGATMIYVTHDQVEAMTMGDRICVMKDGHIMQVAEPLELYNRPANVFVAGFIGSPQMNFFRGKIVPQNSGLRFVENGGAPASVSFELTDSQKNTMSARQGGEVIFGVRPENISIATDGLPAHARANVDICEPMGSETYVYLHNGDTPIIARMPPTVKYAANETCALHFDMGAAHFFDAETEQAIC